MNTFHDDRGRSATGGRPLPSCSWLPAGWRWLTGLAGLLLLGTGCEKPPPASPEVLVVRYAQPQSAAQVQNIGGVDYVAVVRGDKETDISFKVGGVIALIGRQGVDWREGDSVRQGEVLARLKQEDFDNEVHIALAKSELADSTFKRNQELWETKAISKQEFDTALANKSSAAATLAQTRQALADSTLLAPFDGIILARHANSGENTGSGRPVLRISNMRTMKVELGVPDTLVNRFQPGSKVAVQIAALDGHPSFTGVVDEVGVAARADSRLFRVVIKIRNDEGLIKSGMTARVPVGMARPIPRDALLIPLSALLARSRQPRGVTDQLAVFVVRDGLAREATVSTGDLVGSSIIVTGGLSTNDQVVVAGASLLYEGARVQARPMVDPFLK